MTSMTSLHDTWTVWYHYDTQYWTPSSFKELVQLTTIEDICDFAEALKENNLLILEHIYIMRKGIYPIWEDAQNQKGGCWSIKIDIKDSYIILIKVLFYALSENILYDDSINKSFDVTGISLCQKNNYNSVFQIWTRNAKNSKVLLIHSDLLNDFGYEIIFRPHVPEH